MKLINKRTLLAPVLALSLAVTAVGCAEKGPAQKAGQEVDEAAKKAKDAVDPRGPLQKAGADADKKLDGR